MFRYSYNKIFCGGHEHFVKMLKNAHQTRRTVLIGVNGFETEVLHGTTYAKKQTKKLLLVLKSVF